MIPHPSKMARLSRSKVKDREARQQQKAAVEKRTRIEEQQRALVKAATVLQKWVLHTWVLPKRAKARALAKAVWSYNKKVIAQRVPEQAPAKEHYSLQELAELMTVVDSFFA